MKKHAGLLSPVRVLTLALVLPFGTAGAATETYTFRDTLKPNEGGGSGNVLVPTFNFGTPGPGTYVDTTIDANACPNTPTVRGYSFPEYAGLKHLNAAPVVASESYTISMIVKFSPLRSGYTRLIDFSNSTLDEGIYVLNQGISFYPVGKYAPDSFLDNRYSVMTLTRDGKTNVVSLFIGLTPAGTYTDVDKLYVATSGKNLFFFMDNTTGPAAVSESSPGVVTFLRMTDKPITVEELAKTVNEACQAVACGNGKLEAAEGCDDGNIADGDGCTGSCKIENGFACKDSDVPGADAGLARGDSCVAAVCDNRDLKCAFDNGAESTCTGANAKVVCRSGACGSVSLKCVPQGGCFVDGDCPSNACDVATFTCLDGRNAPDAAPPSTDATPLGLDAAPTRPRGREASEGCQCNLGSSGASTPTIALWCAAIAFAIMRRRRPRQYAELNVVSQATTRSMRERR